MLFPKPDWFTLLPPSSSSRKERISSRLLKPRPVQPPIDQVSPGPQSMATPSQANVTGGLAIGPGGKKGEVGARRFG